MQQERGIFDLLVVGSGIAGASAFHQATRDGSGFDRVVLLEQFDELMHSKGSSHGESRIIRIAYDDFHYSLMATKALEMWPSVKDFENFFIKTGGLDIGQLEDENVNKVAKVSKERNIAHEVLIGEQLRQKFPQFTGLPDDTMAVYSPEAGILNPNKIRTVLLSDYDHQKHEIAANERVESIIEDENTETITVVTSSGRRWLTKKLVICVGAYSKKFLKQHFDLDIKFEVLRMCYVYWKITEKGLQEKMFHNSQSPIWIAWGLDPFADKPLDLAYYGFPEWEKKGYIKSATHRTFGDLERGFDPDERAQQIDLGQESPVQKEKLEAMQFYLKKVIPEGLVELDETYEEILNQKDRVVTCLYEMTPTEDFVIDYIPTKSGKKNIATFLGGSGHGFKFGIVIGEMLNELMKKQVANDSSFEVCAVPRQKFSINNIL